MKARHRWTLPAAVLAASLAMVACGGGGGGDNAGSGAGSTPSAQAGAVAITAKNFAFDPNTVSVPSGATTITVTNDDSVTHTFTLDDDSVSKRIAPGTTVTIQLDLTQSIGWHCSIHPQMKGSITVA